VKWCLLSDMSGRRLIVIVLLLVAVCALLAWGIWRIPEPRTVSLELVGYKRWGADSTIYAELRLNNKTRSVIQYPIVPEGDRPSQVPIICREKMPQGWSKEKWDGEAKGWTFTHRDLSPGQSFTFITPVRPGAPPKQVGVLCEIPPDVESSRLKRMLEFWLARTRAALRIPHRQLPRGQVWCPTDIAPPAYDPAKR
jgi:hypothetical protein